MSKDKDDKETAPNNNPDNNNPDNESIGENKTWIPNPGGFGFLDTYLKDLMALTTPSPAIQDLTNQLLAELLRPEGGRPAHFQELFAQIGVTARELSFADDSIDQLILKLKSHDYQVRLQALRQLHERSKSQPNQRLVEPLIAALADPSSMVRQMVPSLLAQIGDARAVKPLISLLYDPDFNIANSAIIALRNFGKAATLSLIEALDQPDPTVRHTIVSLLGDIRDEVALPALKEIARNDESVDPYDLKIKEAAVRAIRHIKPLPHKGHTRKPADLTQEEAAGYDWKILLTGWSVALLNSNSLHLEPSPEAIKNRWLGYPGASDEQIRQAEERLGAKLPPSYRSFLKVTNGWGQLTHFIYKMRSAEEVEWFRVENEDWALIWADNNDDVSDEEYFNYKNEENGYLRGAHMLTSLQISNIGDSCVFLLNPQVVTPEGEWEAWFFANWLPGARRYRSFWEMMQKEYKSFLRLENSK